MTVEQLYDQRIKPLPASDRLRLARLILDGIAPESVVDFQTEWSEEDLRDFSLSAWARLEAEESAGNG
ncbi:MAG TPA: hypothetical protein VF746_16530 [Longimicrobium sp.]|jgi:hypothetical protein